MTEQTTAKAETHVATIYAETLGHDLMAAMLGELRSMPDHWMRLNEEQQQKAIARLRDKVKTMVQETTQILMRGEFPAVAAELDSITIKDGVKITLAMDGGSAGRHALYDAKGRKVLIVMTDTERWLNRMEEIKAKADQLQLFDGDYDPSVDQPGYRRDQPPTAPAGTSWADLKKSLGAKSDGEQQPQDAMRGLGAIPDDATFEQIIIVSERDMRTPLSMLEFQQKDGESVRDAILRSFPTAHFEYDPEGNKPPLQFGTAAEHDASERGQLAKLLEQLWALRITVSLGTLQTFTPEQVQVTREWADAYAADPEGCKIARPHFLPIPDSDTGNDNEQAAEG